MKEYIYFKVPDNETEIQILNEYFTNLGYRTLFTTKYRCCQFHPGYVYLSNTFDPSLLGCRPDGTNMSLVLGRRPQKYIYIDIESILNPQSISIF